MQEELFGVEFNLWMKHKETHKAGRVIENEAVVVGCFFFCAKFSLHTRTIFRVLISLPLRSSHQSEQKHFAPDHSAPTSTSSVDVIPKWPHVPLPVISETAGVATDQVQVC